MPLKVIGTGVGRTGTNSLKLAINRLGLGPCHHMLEVRRNMPLHVPLWQAAADGKPDWEAIYNGYASAVDWPTAGFVRELHAAYPTAKFILSTRSPESWVGSFSETIHKALADKDKAPPEMQEWLAMATRVIERTGFPLTLDAEGRRNAFIAHNEAVKAAIPAEQLLIFQATDGWEPLCAFLGVAVPPEPFPRTNDRIEFWDHVSAKT